METRTEKSDQALLRKRRIHISSKRQITIPAKYYEALGLTDEIDCIYANDMLILKPVRDDDSTFAEEIVADLIKQGYSGQELLSEFKRIKRKIRPAVENLIEEADAIARAASANYEDRTEDIFKVAETEVD